MKTIIYCFALIILLAACKKEKELSTQTPGQSGKPKFAISFNVSNFSQEVKTLNKKNSISDASLNDVATYFAYIAYNSDGVEVSRVTQGNELGGSNASINAVRFYNEVLFPDKFPYYEGTDQPVFGNIVDSLQSGVYTIVMVASTKEFSINNRSNEVLGLTFFPLPEAKFYYKRGLDSWSRAEDTFFKKFTVTVGNSDTEQAVVLDRIVGKAEIKILDSRPGTSYRFLFVHENESYEFSSEQPSGNTSDGDSDYDQYQPLIPGTSNLLYSKFVLNTQTPVDVIIKAYEGGILSAIKTVQGVRFYKNKRTILTGNLHTPASNSTGFTVTVDEEFDPDSTVITF